MIVRSPRENGFTMVHNATFEDDRLSFEARGLLAFLLVKPDNWRIDIENLQRAGGIGRNQVYRILKELISAGFIVRAQVRTRHGAEPIDYTVYDRPQVPACQLPENRETGASFPEASIQDSQLPGNGHARIKNQKAPINQKAPSNANALRRAAKQASGRDGLKPVRPVAKQVAREEKPGPFRDVFRAVCKVRRKNPDMIDDDTRSNTRRLAGRLLRNGVNDSDTVEAWGARWYQEMATTHRKRMDAVSPPTIVQLTTHFGGCIAERDGVVLVLPATSDPAADDWGWPT